MSVESQPNGNCAQRLPHLHGTRAFSMFPREARVAASPTIRKATHGPEPGQAGKLSVKNPDGGMTGTASRNSGHGSASIAGMVKDSMAKDQTLRAAGIHHGASLNRQPRGILVKGTGSVLSPERGPVSGAMVHDDMFQSTQGCATWAGAGPGPEHYNPRGNKDGMLELPTEDDMR